MFIEKRKFFQAGAFVDLGVRGEDVVLCKKLLNQSAVAIYNDDISVYPL